MGQAAVDLPDPLESSSPKPASNADDLLSQLAGEEIDRLLAEADVDRAGATPVTFAPPAEESAPPESPPHPAPLADAPITPTPEPAPAAAATEPEKAEVAPDLNAQIDTLFAALTAPPGSPPPSTAATPAAPASAHAPYDAAAPTSAEAPAAKAPKTNLQSVAEDTAKIFPETPRLPLLLRPLEWISAPLDAMGEPVRQMLGKIGIITTVNALAVLVYVLFFRRH